MHGVERDPRRTVHRIERIRTHPYDVAGARGAESLGEGQVVAQRTCAVLALGSTQGRV